MDVKKLAQLASEGQAGTEIQKLIALPWADAFRISLRNVTLRIGRAAITAAGIILGIAFLMSVLTSKVAQEGIDRSEANKFSHSVETIQSVDQGTPESKKEADDAKAQRAGKQDWLVVMSLLVCGVGITNSMLMSVTERFREIGTMKCLGALDGFIVRLFLIESALLGFIGSIVGVLIGHLFILLSVCIKSGFSTPAKMDWKEMGFYILISLVVGTLLSLLAAIIPARAAARMPAAAALSTEV
jgi:predicted lysophospholipase L1 biosynthesis ABC-type transport system permease subunit